MKKAFTLIELLVSIAIMAVIMAASLVAFQGTRANSRDGRRKADLEATRSALELYRSDIGGYPANLGLLVPSYIAANLTDTLGDRQYIYTVSGTSTYTLCAALENPVAGADVSGCGSCGSVVCSYKTSNP